LTLEKPDYAAPVTIIAEPSPVSGRAALFRSGSDQALRIPKAFELPGNEVILHREGSRIVIDPIINKQGLLAVIAWLEPLAENFPDVDSGVLPLDDIAL
jgi:antitoxin VapB